MKAKDKKDKNKSKSINSVLSAHYKSFNNNTFLEQSLKELIEEDFLSEKSNVSKKQIINDLKAEIEIVKNSNLSQADKIYWLNFINNTGFKPLIVKLAYRNGLEETECLANIFEHIAYSKVELGNLTKEINHYTDAAIFYQYVLSIIQNKVSPNVHLDGYKDKKEEINKALNNIKQLIIFSIKVSDITEEEYIVNDVKKESDTFKQLLENLRNASSQSLELIEDYRIKSNHTEQLYEKKKYESLYSEKTKELFEYIASNMRSFLAGIYAEAESEIGEAPCKYSVMGLGSMAIQQMTPYSDLEFAIITDNEAFKQSPNQRIRDYFKNLTHLVHLKIINLGESKIPNSIFDVDLAPLINLGVCFDLGGKTPLGRIARDKPYDLINTIDGMLKYVRNEDNKTTHIDKYLPYILEKVCYIYGEKELIKEYQVRVNNFLLEPAVNDAYGRLNCEIRSLNLMREEALEINYCNTANTSSQTLYKRNLDKLKPNLSDAQGKLFDVKEEIYRLPDRMIYNLGLYFGIENNNAWDTLEKLFKRSIINEQALNNLAYAVTFAATLRLKTYLHHKAQVEDISIFSNNFIHLNDSSKEKIAKVFHLPSEDLEEGGGLFKYYYTALPFHQSLEEFCNHYMCNLSLNKEEYFKDKTFYLNDTVSNGLIHFRLLHFKEARSILENAIKESINQDNLKLKILLGEIYIGFGAGDKAIDLFQYCLNTAKNSGGQPEEIIRVSSFGLSAAYRMLGNYVEAIKITQKCLDELRQTNNDEPNIKIAISQTNLATLYSDIGKYNDALAYCEESLNTLKAVYANEYYKAIADTLNVLGCINRDIGKYYKAKELYDKSLDIRKFIYKNELHLDIAESYTNLGNISADIGDYDEANKFFYISLQIQRFIYKNDIYPSIANTLNNIAVTYGEMGRREESNKIYAECLEIRKKINMSEQNSTNLSDAITLYQLGCAYRDTLEYDKAITSFIKSKELSEALFKGRAHLRVVAALDALAITYESINKYDDAKEYCKESLSIQKIIYGHKQHPNIISTQFTLGNIYLSLDNYSKAKKCFKENINILNNIYTKGIHMAIAGALGSLGNFYSAKGKFEKAIDYYNKGLTILNTIFSEKSHPFIVATLNNIGQTLIKLGKFDEAIQLCNKSLEIQRKLYEGDFHPFTAAIFNNLANAYSKIGNYALSIELCNKSLSIKEKIYNGQPHLEVAISLNNLGNLYADQENYSKAIEYLEKSLRVKKHIIKDKPHISIATTILNIAEAYGGLGNFNKAIELCNESIEIQKSVYVNSLPPNLVFSLNNLGIYYKYLENYNESINTYIQIIKILFDNPDILDKISVQRSISHLAITLSEKYSLDPLYPLNPSNIYDKLFSSTEQGYNFTNYKFHYESSFITEMYNIDQLEEIIEAYNLALYFLPEEEHEAKEILNHLLYNAPVKLKKAELWLAAKYGDKEKLKLFEENSELNYEILGTSPLVEAIINGQIEAVNYLISKGSDTKLLYKGQIPILFFALGYFGKPLNIPILKILLKDGADANQPLDDGDTPIHMAHYQGSEEAIQLLLDYCADINKKNKEGKTPLHCLLSAEYIDTQSKVDLIKRFIDLYDFDAKDNADKSIESYATKYCPQIILLIYNKEDLSEKILSTEDIELQQILIPLNGNTGDTNYKEMYDS
jgi:tetratricopeptide (TPR) repeat protein